MEYRVTDIITLLNAEYKGEVIESVSKLSPFFHSDEKSLTFAADEKFLKNLLCFTYSFPFKNFFIKSSHFFVYNS